MKRFVAFMLVSLLLLSACACSKSKLGGGSINDTVIMKIDGRGVTEDEYNYFYNNYKRDFGENADESKIKAAAIEALKSNYAIFHMAEKYDIKLDKNDRKSIDAQIQATMDKYGGSDKYYTALNSAFITGDVYRKILETQTLETKVRSYVLEDFSGEIPADDVTVDNDIRTNFIRATQIMIASNNGKTDSENLNLANELLTKIKAGENFDNLATQYGEDTGLNVANGYYITKGEYHKFFEDVAFALEIGEVSDVVKSSFGYHIIKRLPMDEDYIKDYFEELRVVYKNRVFNEMLLDIASKLEVKLEV